MICTFNGLILWQIYVKNITPLIKINLFQEWIPKCYPKQEEYTKNAKESNHYLKIKDKKSMPRAKCHMKQKGAQVKKNIHHLILYQEHPEILIYYELQPNQILKQIMI